MYQICDFGKMMMFCVDRDKRHATAATVAEQEMFFEFIVFILSISLLI